MIRYEVDGPVSVEQLCDLYRALGWKAGTMPERVARAVAAPNRHVAVWDGDRLVGYARLITDGEFCLYLHEILLYPEYQRQGHGAQLMRRILEGLEHVTNKVLLADTGNPPFYQRFGFRLVEPSMGFQAMFAFGKL